MSQSYFYLKPTVAGNVQVGDVGATDISGVVSSGVNELQPVSGYLDSEGFVITDDYEIIQNGKVVSLSGTDAVGKISYMGVKPGEYPDTFAKRQLRTGYLTRISDS